MFTFIPQVSRGQLSAEVRRARVLAGLTQKRVAEEMEWTAGKVIRIEMGQSGVSKPDLLALLSLYDVTDPIRTGQLVSLAAGSRQRQRQPGGSYRNLFSPAFGLYLGYERIADRILQFTPCLLPDLLQTAQYARSFTPVGEPYPPPDRVRARLEALRFRQEILDRTDPPRAHFLIPETALRRWPEQRDGHPDLRQEQLQRLRHLAARPTIQIQTIPLTYTAHFGMGSSWSILEFDDPEEPDLLYVDGGRPSPLTRDRPDLIAPYKDTFRQLQEQLTTTPELDCDPPSQVRSWLR